MVRIAEIEAGSIAEELSLEIGTRIVRINGERVRDGIDLTFLLADTALELEALSPSGESVVYDIEREPGTPVGIVPAPDTIRECANKCVFCFIDGNPQGVRETLWLRDDDFRLSFTYGSYVTLTNLGPKGMQRLVDQRISPLYVSVHATEPEVRRRLLVNETAGDIMDRLRFLLDGGLDVHTQAVVCPGWNDAEHLDRTLEDLWGLGPRVRSISVVPVGLTRYNLNRPVRLMTPAEARRTVEQVDEARARALAERDQGWCYSADEMYLTAGLPVPHDDYYDDGALYENGVGAVRRFIDRFAESLPHLPRLDGRRLRLVTARSMAPFLRERASLLEGATGARVEVVEVTNAFFGATVSVAGLLSGADIRDALLRGGQSRTGDVVLLPAEALNADGVFIDSLPLAELERALEPARVVRGYDIGEALTAL